MAGSEGQVAEKKRALLPEGVLLKPSMLKEQFFSSTHCGLALLYLQ